jgi:alpha-glucosidase
VTGIDAKTFYDFLKMVARLRNDNFRRVTITNLHIAHATNQWNTPYDTGDAGDHFLPHSAFSRGTRLVFSAT